MQGYLAVTARNIEDDLPKEGTLIEDDGLIIDITGKFNLSQPSYDFKIFIQGKKTSLSLWEIERKNLFIGGSTGNDEEYRIKNIATGMFLSASEIGSKLGLVPDGNSELTLF